MMRRTRIRSAARTCFFLILALATVSRPLPAEKNVLAPPVEFVLTTDLPQMIKSDFQAEFIDVLSSRTSWAIRAGLYHHLQSSSQKYKDGKGHWEVGFRWRTYFLERAPHWLFLGIGWNNRPQDGQITPLAELGFSLNLRPLTLMALGTCGYEIYLGETADLPDKWVAGFEIRAGLCY